MSVSAISDFSEDEIQSIRWGLDFRWRNQDIELHMADVEADLADVQKEHGQDAVDRLIVELELDRVFKLEPGSDFSSLTRY